MSNAQFLELFISLLELFLFSLVGLELVPELFDFKLAVDDNGLFEGVVWLDDLELAWSLLILKFGLHINRFVRDYLLIIKFELLGGDWLLEGLLVIWNRFLGTFLRDFCLFGSSFLRSLKLSSKDLLIKPFAILTELVSDMANHLPIEGGLLEIFYRFDAGPLVVKPLQVGNEVIGKEAINFDISSDIVAIVNHEVAKTQFDQFLILTQQIPVEVTCRLSSLFWSHLNAIEFNFINAFCPLIRA